MAEELQGRTAIVTGSGRGIGRGIAIAYGRAGANVVVASRTFATVNEVVAVIRSEGGTAIAAPCDVGVRADIERTVAAAVEAFGSVHILVNNAQGHGARGRPSAHPVPQPLEVFDEAHWDFALETGPLASLRAMQAVFPLMKAQGWGRIINFGSRWGQVGHEGSAAYNSAKEAIRSLTRTAAREWGQYGITCNVINPTIVTEAYEAYAQAHPAEHAANLAALPLRRAGTALEDLGPVAVFVASEQSGYLTGMTFMVDGGKEMMV